MYQNFQIGPFAGLNQNENPHALADNDLRAAENCAARGALVGTRPGCSPLGSDEDYENALTSTPAIQGAFEYRNNFDQNRALIVIAHNGTATRKIWYQDAAQLPAGPTLTTNADYIWSFANHQNVLWGAGGPAGRAQVVTEPVWYWLGNTSAAAVDYTAAGFTDKGSNVALRPKFIKSWNGYVLINGLQQGTPIASNNPTVTRYATFATDPKVNANWPDSNTVGFNPARKGIEAYGQSHSTGFGTYQDNSGDYLLLLFNTHIAAVVLDPGSDFRVNDTIPNGCVHQRAAVDLGTDSGEFIYVSEYGVHSLRQSQQHGVKEDAFISWKIRDFWNSLNRNRIPYTTAAYDRKNGRVVFAFSTGSETTHDTLMALEVKDLSGALSAQTARWFGPWTIVDETKSDNKARIQHLEYMRNASDDWYLYAFTTDGKVLRFTEDVYQDLGQYGYTVDLRTKDLFGDTLTEKRVGDAMVTIGPLGSHTVTTRAVFDLGRKSTVTSAKLRSPSGAKVGVDRVGVGEIGESFSMSEDKVRYRGKGRTVAFQFEHNRPSEPVLIGQLVVGIQGAGEARGEE